MWLKKGLCGSVGSDLLWVDASVSHEFASPLKAHVVSLSKKLYQCCLVLVGSINGFERDFSFELK